jgi:acetyltransferase-like isoleucine patch superfamily enzyme
VKLVVYRTGRVLEPLGDPVSEAHVGVRTLGEHQRGLASLLGLAFQEAPDANAVDTGGEPALVLADHTLVTARLVRALLRVTRSSTADARVALPGSRFVTLYGQHQGTTPLADGGAAYDAWLFPTGLQAGAFPARSAAAAPLVVPFKEKVIPFPVPPNIVGRPQHDHPLTTTIALHVKHWVHLLWANNLWPQVELVERITSAPLSTAWRLLTGLRLGKQATFWALARRFTYVGRGVDIHPTACVEASVLGEGCSVGPFALVRGSVLGKGVRVEERANVCFSTLGDRDFVSKNSTVVLCAGYPDADLCVNGMQYCLAGRHAALTSLVRPMDMKYRDDVTVVMDGQPVPIRELMVGVCFGHRCFVGPDVLIGPGREIPNDAVVAPPPGSVMSRVDPEARAGGPCFVDRGVLKPLRPGDG